MVHKRWKGKHKTKDEYKRVVNRDKSGFMEAMTKKKKKELRFAKKLRMRKIDLGTHSKQEDK